MTAQKKERRTWVAHDYTSRTPQQVLMAISQAVTEAERQAEFQSDDTPETLEIHAKRHHVVHLGRDLLQAGEPTEMLRIEISWEIP